ncbi:MAG: SO_0444 family Cu/Zn efflux transporter [Deltaproteobacteria bacterium]|nr:SO_0444 family Cu/Zn efflux transporter [Deltaproteobacteria bacterium]MBW1924174.1 SO_0444 family Cu/Zn efflux transporter [Deltaproteobacteria bacterium]MBW1951039.1 SO_0444 family Cu/Zn efflux transporter [Deltaproteobacteria bacterium]MBW2009131.1 SO_0444 family Cu/Zn efflux transporter [Deltaproteobacteria bacterium]MBW2104153.1 SO_0444 family Cu/Zn efflux transporter [Deltaproteobacteria bacterium]
MNLIIKTMEESWALLLEAAPYVLFGLLVSGLLRVFLSPSAVAAHLGKGRFLSVFKAGLLGIPLPLCSCGVLPAAVGLKKQGANNGAATAFLISTPESGVDSIAITYALLDPIMTVARPVAAFVTAAMAGISENLLGKRDDFRQEPVPDLTCPVDSCCDGVDCSPEIHRNHHSPHEKVKAGVRFALGDVWGDMAGWFFVGLLLAGLITALVPERIMAAYLGGGMLSMLVMLAVGVPLYICATASTPIAAALIMKGVSPGAALVFLLAGPSTNVTSLTVLFGILGKRATAIYLAAIAAGAVAFGLTVDAVYEALGLSAGAMVGQASEFLPDWVRWISVAVLLLISIRPLRSALRWPRHRGVHEHPADEKGCGEQANALPTACATPT